MWILASRGWLMVLLRAWLRALQRLRLLRDVRPASCGGCKRRLRLDISSSCFYNRFLFGCILLKTNIVDYNPVLHVLYVGIISLLRTHIVCYIMTY
jgi:hypothetical protein